MLRLAACSLFFTASLAGTAAASSFVTVAPPGNLARSSFVEIAPPAAPMIDPMPTLSLEAAEPVVIRAPDFVAASPSILVMVAALQEESPPLRAQSAREPLPQVIRGGIIDVPGAAVERPAETQPAPVEQTRRSEPTSPAPSPPAPGPQRREPALPPAAPPQQVLPPAAEPTGVPL